MVRKSKIIIQTSQGDMTLREIADFTGIRLEIIKSRYAKGKRGDDLLTPLSQKGRKVLIGFRGQKRTAYEIAEITGIPYFDIYSRYKNGYRGEELVRPIRKPHSHIGERYGNLVVIDETRKSGQIYVTCLCDCGNTCQRFLSALKNDSFLHTCGCEKNWASTHNMSKSKEHKAWRHIKDRCLNPNAKNYADYGGRGIKICDRWKESFENFYADMGPSPSPRHSIDRIDVNGDYCPDNCRWATTLTQMRNTRRTIYLNYHGETKPLTEWAEILHINPHNLREAWRRGADPVEYIGKLLKDRVVL